MRKFLIGVLFAWQSCLAEAGTVHYVDFVNTSASDIVSFEVARPGSSRFHPVLGRNKRLPGGAPATIAIRQDDDGCLRDLRMGFADGHVRIWRGFDLCRGSRRTSARE